MWFAAHRPRLEHFRDLHAGEKCFIIGNGPSLNRMDLSLLDDVVCFGLNKIYLIFERSGLKIDYHAVVNPLVIEQARHEIERLDCPKFVSYWGSRANPVRGPHAYTLLTDGEFCFQGDVSKPIHEGHTVTFVALQLAFFMGFTEVFLIGVDHNFQASGKPNEKQHMAGADPNHFDPDYFRGQQWHLPDLEASELAYRMASFHYRRHGRAIYDATVDGKLDVFPKLSYEQALERCRGRG